MSPYFAQTKLYIKLKTNKKGVANSEWSQIFRLYNKFSKFPNNNHWSNFAKGGLTALSNQSNIIQGRPERSRQSNWAVFTVEGELDAKCPYLE